MVRNTQAQRVALAASLAAARQASQANVASPSLADSDMSDLPISQQVGTVAASTQPTVDTVDPAPSNTEMRGVTADVAAIQVASGQPVSSQQEQQLAPSDPRLQQTSAAETQQHVSALAGAAPMLGPMPDMSDERFRELMDRYISQIGQVVPPTSMPTGVAHASIPVAPTVPIDPVPITQSVSKLTTRDVKLPPFSGSADANALHVDASYYLPLLEWVNEARTLLHFSGMPNRDQVFTIFNALSGPARRVLMLRGVNIAVTPDELLDNLVKSIPDHTTVFTNQALEMTFSLKTLRKDIETFGLLLSYGGFPTTNNRFWFQQLTRKMLHAKENLLMLSASLLNVQLDYRPDEPFQHLIARSVDIVTRLQQENVLTVQRLGLGPAADLGESSGRRGNAPGKRKNAQSDISSKRSKHGDGPSYNELAKQYDRCLKCGYHVKPNDAARTKHLAECKANPNTFKNRMRKVKAMVSQGKGDQVNNFPKSK